jgi:hypothetical protein
MKVLFVAGFGAIVRDTETVEGVKYFSLWPLADAAESCFGSREPRIEPWGQTVARSSAPKGFSSE